MGRGRKAIAIDKHELASAIAVVESNGPLVNRSLLWDAVVQELFNRNIKVSSAFVYQKVKAFDLEGVLATPIGKRGRAGGNPNLGTGPRVTAADKFSKSSDIQKSLDLIEAEYGKKFPSKIKKLRKGNRRSAIETKCIDCSGDSLTEARACRILSCPLWPFMRRRAIVEVVELKPVIVKKVLTTE